MIGKAERAMLAHWLVRTSRGHPFPDPAGSDLPGRYFSCRPGFFFCRPGFFLPARLFFAGPAFFAGPVFRLPGRLFFCQAGFFLPGRLLPDRLAQTGPVVKSRAHPAFGRLSLHFAWLWCGVSLIHKKRRGF